MLWVGSARPLNRFITETSSYDESDSDEVGAHRDPRTTATPWL